MEVLETKTNTAAHFDTRATQETVTELDDLQLVLVGGGNATVVW